jgi:hypothetical protein
MIFSVQPTNLATLPSIWLTATHKNDNTSCITWTPPVKIIDAYGTGWRAKGIRFASLLSDTGGYYIIFTGLSSRISPKESAQYLGAIARAHATNYRDSWVITDSVDAQGLSAVFPHPHTFLTDSAAELGNLTLEDSTANVMDVKNVDGTYVMSFVNNHNFSLALFARARSLSDTFTNQWNPVFPNDTRNAGSRPNCVMFYDPPTQTWCCTSSEWGGFRWFNAYFHTWDSLAAPAKWDAVMAGSTIANGSICKDHTRAVPESLGVFDVAVGGGTERVFVAKAPPSSQHPFNINAGTGLKTAKIFLQNLAFFWYSKISDITAPQTRPHMVGNPQHLAPAPYVNQFMSLGSDTVCDYVGHVGETEACDKGTDDRPYYQTVLLNSRIWGWWGTLTTGDTSMFTLGRMVSGGAPQDPPFNFATTLTSTLQEYHRWEVRYFNSVTGDTGYFALYKDNAKVWGEANLIPNLTSAGKSFLMTACENGSPGAGGGLYMKYFGARPYTIDPTVTLPGCYDASGHAITCSDSLLIGYVKADTALLWDANLDTTLPTTNLGGGGATSINAGIVQPGTTRIQDGAIRSDHSAVPSNATVASDTVWLWAKTVDNPPFTISIHKLNVSWAELTVTWDSPWNAVLLHNGPNEAFDPVPLCSRVIQHADSGTWVGFAIPSSFIQNQLAGTPNYGMIIRQETNRLSQVKVRLEMVSKQGTWVERASGGHCWFESIRYTKATPQ